MTFKGLSAADFFNNKYSLRGTRPWTAAQGHTLLLRPEAAASPIQKPKKSAAASGPPQDYTYLRHKAEGLKADHPVNRDYT